MSSAFLRWLLIVTLSAAVTTESNTRGLRVVHKLVGGHLSLHRDDDIELMTSGAGEGRDKNKPHAKEEKKTLSQQVADGKYGLIQNELFSKPIKRPGIISYSDNHEVPSDNISNLGGLNKSDIWLSENHLLVIKGGGYPDHSLDNKDYLWPAIDDYNAPDRQVKIPSHPKVPPPFPVQLEEGGPLLFLGTNVTKTLNSSFEQGVYPIYPEENYVTGGDGSKQERFPGGRHPSYPPAGEAPFPIPPFPPPGLGFYDPSKEGALNDTFPIFFGLPPTGDFPNFDNVSYDDDDPSIYYPPPYSFFYQKDNSTNVPPGPLVPGIVLPPPPNFFAPLEEDKGTKKPTTSTTTARPTIKTTQIPVLTTTKLRERTKYYFYPIVNHTVTTSSTRKPTTTQTYKKKYPTITILKPISTSTKQPEYTGSPFRVYGPPQPTDKPRVMVTSTRIPLKTYYTTTHIEPILITEKPKTERTHIQTTPKNVQIQKVEGVEIQHASKEVLDIPRRIIQKPQIVNVPRKNVQKANGVIQTTTPSPPVQYYFYEDINTTPAPAPIKEDKYPKQYYIPKEILIPKRPTIAAPVNNVRYYFVGEPDYHQEIKKPDTFSIHIARLKQEIENYQNSKNYNRNNYDTSNNFQRPYEPKPVYQYEFQAAGYQDPQNQYVDQKHRYIEPKHQYIDQKRQYLDPKLQYIDPKLRTLQQYSVEIQEAVEVTAPTPIYETTQEGNSYSAGVTENPGKINNLRPNRQRTSRPISEYSFEATQNPLYQQYYTKQDEKYIDDVTKEYFTVFGKRLPVGTTPLPIQRQKYYNQEQKVPISLERDTFVNYLQQRPQINPHSEFVLNQNSEVDYERSRRPVISYKLPGDEGTHFYFLTPQLAQERNQDARFYFSRAARQNKRADFT